MEAEEESRLMFDFNLDQDLDKPHIPDARDGLVAPPSFDYWNELVPELKVSVVGKMDYFTRTRLSFCSQNDYDVVDSTPCEIAVIEVHDNGDKNYQIYPEKTIKNVFVRIEFDEKSTRNSEIELHFVKWDGYTEVAWISYPAGKRPTKKSITISNADNIDAAAKFVEKWMKKARYNVKELIVEMERWPIETSTIQNLHQCTSLRVRNQNGEMLKWWLRKTDPEKLKKLHLFDAFDDEALSQELLSMDHIKMCESLELLGYCNFTDEQFLSLKGRFIRMESDTITDEAINRFITNWTRGEVREDFVILSIWLNREYDKAEIVKNLTLRPWDEDFERESRGFAHDWTHAFGRYDCNQIYKTGGSGISATMSLSDDRIIFAVTGSMLIQQDRRIPDYNVPRFQ